MEARKKSNTEKINRLILMLKEASRGCDLENAGKAMEEVISRNFSKVMTLTEAFDEIDEPVDGRTG